MWDINKSSTVPAPMDLRSSESSGVVGAKGACHSGPSGKASCRALSNQKHKCWRSEEVFQRGRE